MTLSTTTTSARGDGLAHYFLLACASTWLLASPAAYAWLHGRALTPLAVACAGLSAFGPLIAAVSAARFRGRLREVFGHYRCAPRWVVLALCAPTTIHLLARALYVALGGQVTAWLALPLGPEQLAAALVFPLGEEFGWRGFAHAPMLRRFGATRGALLLGLGWAVWHLAYAITPEAKGFDSFAFALTMLELPLYAVLIAWLFERAGRSMLVALAFHVGGHIDHIERIGRTTPGLHALHVALLAVLALWAAREMSAPGRPAMLA